MDKPLPYINAALLCESVIEEKNGSLTVVRIADKVEMKVAGLPEGYKPIIAIKGLLSLKSGPVKGDFNIEIRIVRPNGEVKKDRILVPFKLLGEDQGSNIILNISLGIEEEGLHWFDVYFEGQLLTRMPLTVVRTQELLEPK
jgi:uncharacterized protein DUF6941